MGPSPAVSPRVAAAHTHWQKVGIWGFWPFSHTSADSIHMNQKKLWQNPSPLRNCLGLPGQGTLATLAQLASHFQRCRTWS